MRCHWCTFLTGPWSEWCHWQDSRQVENLMAHGNARVEKWRGKRRMEGVASTVVHCIGHGLSSITTADPHTSAASSRLNWHPRRYKWTRPFRWKTKSSFCACAIRFHFCSSVRSLPTPTTLLPAHAVVLGRPVNTWSAELKIAAISHFVVYKVLMWHFTLNKI